MRRIVCAGEEAGGVGGTLNARSGVSSSPEAVKAGDELILFAFTPAYL